MVDKEKQIEETEHDISHVDDGYQQDANSHKIEELIKRKGWVKLPEDSMVISRKEYEEYKEFKSFMERNDWESIDDIETTLDKCQEVLYERLQQSIKVTAENLLSELYYIARFYYGNNANILTWAKDKATKLGVEIKE